MNFSRKLTGGEAEIAAGAAAAAAAVGGITALPPMPPKQRAGGLRAHAELVERAEGEECEGVREG